MWDISKHRKALHGVETEDRGALQSQDSVNIHGGSGI